MPVRNSTSIKKTSRSNRPGLDRQKLLDLYFLEARSKLIDIAAFLDRIGKSRGPSDFRLKSFQKALKKLHETKNRRAQSILLHLSDPTSRPILSAGTKSASGAWNPRQSKK